MLRKSALPLLLAILVLPSAAPAAAPPVDVQVMVIRASKKGSTVDKELEPLKRQLSSFAFSSYRLVETKALRLTFGRKGEVRLPDGNVLEILPVGRDEGGNLRVKLKIAGLVDTTYAIAPGGTIIVGGGMKYEDGELILAVTQTAAGS